MVAAAMVTVTQPCALFTECSIASLREAAEAYTFWRCGWLWTAAVATVESASVRLNPSS